MKKFLSILACLGCIFLTCKGSLTLTPEMAVNLVKNQRTTAQNDSSDFYAKVMGHLAHRCNKFNQVSFNENRSSFSVNLWKTAESGTTIVITPTLGNFPSLTLNISGKDEGTLDVSGLPAGLYAVALQRNGETLDSVQIIK